MMSDELTRTITVELPGQDPAPGSGKLPSLEELRRLAPAALGSASSLPAAPFSAAGDDPLAGTVIGGRYKIERVVGEGGYGRVYEAEHLVLGQRVAIKTLLEEHAADPAILARFVLEARTAATIRHPAVVPVHDYGQTPGSIPYMVMELVAGDALADVIRRYGPARPEVVRPLFAQVAGGLAAAHAAGVIHRDLKPENLVVSADRTEARLVDFGLCIHWRAEERLTAQGQLFGSIHYVAPERIKDEEPTDRSDVYSLGCVMFEALTGRPVFEALKDVAIARAHLTAKAPRVGPLAPEPVPDDFEDLIASCLAKAPADRPSMADVEASLRGHARSRTRPFAARQAALRSRSPRLRPHGPAPKTAQVSMKRLAIHHHRTRRIILAVAGGLGLVAASAAGAFAALSLLPGA